MSDHHHGSGRYFKDSSYGGGSSKRYHSPGDSGRSGMSGYYDTLKKSRTDTYSGSGGGSFHTSSSSSRYNEYSSTGGSLMSSRYKPSSSSAYYNNSSGSGGMKSSSSSSKYLDDYKGSSSRSMLKSSVRRIPPSLTPPSLSSKSMMKSSFSSSSHRQPLPPLMKLNTVSSLGGGSRDIYGGGSRLRTAPPEHHHSSSYGSYSSSLNNRKQEFKRPQVGVLRNPYGPTVTVGSSTTAIRRSTIRAAANVSSKIRRRAVASVMEDRRRKRIEVSHTSRRDDRTRGSRIEKRPTKDEVGRKRLKDSESKESGSESVKEKDDKVEVPMGEMAVVVEEEVGGETDDDETEKSKKDKVNDENEEDDSTMTKKDDEEENSTGEKLDHEHHHEHSSERNKRRTKAERDASPSSRALLKLYCKYCDTRAVTFREYSQHLRSFQHTKAMNTSVTDMRKQLSKLRTQQRDDQRRVEKEEKVLSDTTSYCRVCELNFRTDPKEHEANELHNEIKTLIYQRCDICDIDFRIWKVYLYHMAALEHVKRIAMRELKEAESKSDCVKGTNLSVEELGADLVEVRTVFFCNACVRYLPIKGDVEEAKSRHCMTLSHVKGVEEFRQREKRIAERQRLRMEREEREKLLREEASKTDTSEKDENEKTEVEGGEGTESADQTISTSLTGDNLDGAKVKLEPDVDNVEEPVASANSTINIKQEVEVEAENTEAVADVEGEENNEDDQDVDEDEIELHAGDDVADDESEDHRGWNRRTRSAKSSN